jgi:hypothetical protein
VVSYDLAGDGTLVWSDGATVWLQPEGGKRERLCTGKGVTGVAILDE